MRGCWTLAVAGALLLGAAAPRVAAAAGGVRGVVRVTKAPAPRPVRPVVKDGAVCGKDVPDESLLVGADRGLANVVVSVRGAKGPPAAAPKAAVLDQVGCRYVPHVQAVRVGAPMSIVNSDAVFHNVHAHLDQGGDSRTIFNLAMPFKGQKLPAKLKSAGYHAVRCDAGHTWMTAFIAAFDHDQFAVTDKDGRFTIEGVAPGQQTLELWHEPLGGKGAGVTKTVVVTIEDGKVTSIEPTFEP